MGWLSSLTKFFSRSPGKASSSVAKTVVKDIGKGAKMVWDPAIGNMVKVTEPIAKAGGALINNTVKIITPATGAVTNAARTGWKTVGKMIGGSAIAGTFVGVSITVMSWWSGISESIAGALNIPREAASGVLLVIVLVVTASVLYVMYKLVRRR